MLRLDDKVVLTKDEQNRLRAKAAQNGFVVSEVSNEDEYLEALLLAADFDSPLINDLTAALEARLNKSVGQSDTTP